LNKQYLEDRTKELWLASVVLSWQMI
jgi:hypothetical protein